MDDALRPAELAGAYYPALPEACRAALEGFPALGAPAGKAVGALAPHGGWRYAGRIAVGTLRALCERRPDLDLVVLLGGHLEPGDALRVFIQGHWETPLGPVGTPVALAEAVAMGLSAEPETALEYYDDNAVEVLVPIVRWLWPEVPMLVVGVPPDADPGPVALEILEQAENEGFGALGVIGSTDLTHYGPDYRFRPRGGGEAAHRWVLEENDRALLRHVAALDYHKVAWEGPRMRNTCSAGAVSVALALAQKLGAVEGRCLEQSSSWLEGGRDPEMKSFIGYAGVLLGRFSEDA